MVYKYRYNIKKMALTRELKRKRKIRAVEYLGGCCTHCKGVFHPCVYDFHHIDPAIKENQVALILSRRWERVVEELNKCILLCSNCHRLEHYNKGAQQTGAANLLTRLEFNPFN